MPVSRYRFKWTGIDGIDPASRGELMDARQLVVLEKFMGEGYVGWDGPTNPHHQSAPLPIQAYGETRTEALEARGAPAATPLRDAPVGFQFLSR